MLIITATIVRRAKRMNSDIQIINTLPDDPGDCSSTGFPGDELVEIVFVTVIALGVAEMVTTVLEIASLVTNCTSVLVLVCDRTSVLVVMVVDVAVTD